MFLDIQDIFNKLMGVKAFSFLVPKRLIEVRMTNNPKYCPYHNIVSHVIKDCYIFTDIIKGMIRKERSR